MKLIKQNRRRVHIKKAIGFRQRFRKPRVIIRKDHLEHTRLPDWMQELENLNHADLTTKKAG